MKVELGYGDGFKSLWIPEDMQADIMRAGSCPKMEGKEGRKPVEEALLCPIGTGRLRDLSFLSLIYQQSLQLSLLSLMSQRYLLHILLQAALYLKVWLRQSFSS